MSSSTEQAEGRPGDDFVPTEELIRRHGTEPITLADELAQPDPWESEQEYQKFLDDLYASRWSGISPN